MKYRQNLQYHLAELNDEQRDAVLCRSSIVYVAAGPGSGKTHMLTSKLVDYIISTESTQHLVALSFTNTAARQIGERFEKKAVGIDKEFSFFHGTIHSFCYRMLLQSRAAFDYAILDDEELQELADDIKGSLNPDVPKDLVLRCLRTDLSQSGSALFNSIMTLKVALKVISIQDILTMFIKELEENPSFREWIATQVTVMAIDEAQDLSELNYIILDKMLEAIPDLKIFLVGDPRQNIFEFNGGSYRHLEDFLSRHPEHETKTLTVTYRCGKPITDFVNTFHFMDCENYAMRPINEGGYLSVMDTCSEVEEADRIIGTIMEIDNINSCAVITNNLRYMNPLIGKLQNEHIPYKVYGGVKTLKRHIRFLNHILRIIDSDNAYSIRKIAQYAGIDIMKDGRRNKRRFFESDLGQIILSMREDVPFHITANRVIEEIMRDPSDDQSLSDDYDSFLNLSTQYSTVSDYLTSFSTDKERFAAFYTAEVKECDDPTDRGFLTLTTIHSAKGLEWDNVFIIGLCEGNFPNPYFCTKLPPEKQEEFFNSEWKKMYVASTRARKHLFLTYSSSLCRKGYTFRKAPSRFIENCRRS